MSGGVFMRPTRGEIDTAIRSIEHSRQTHVDWAHYARLHPDWAKARAPRSESAGDVEHHDKCIREYDQVLDVLKRVRG